MTNREKLVDIGYENSIVYQNPDFDNAIIGVDEISNSVIYDYEMMVGELMEKDNMSELQAVEFIDYNTIRATPYMPQPRPIILRKLLD